MVAKHPPKVYEIVRFYQGVQYIFVAQMEEAIVLETIQW